MRSGVLTEKYAEDENIVLCLKSLHIIFSAHSLFPCQPKAPNKGLLKQSGTTGGKATKSFFINGVVGMEIRRSSLSQSLSCWAVGFIWIHLQWP